MAELEEYKVDKDLCIDCNACYTTYPEVFKQIPWEGATKAEAYAPVTLGKYNPWDVLGVCPTDAISKIGAMPPKPEKAEGAEALPPLEDLGPWEERFARAKGEKDSKWDVMKRYGMAATVSEDRNRYVIRMELPEKTPAHILKYKMGLPDAMPDYKIEVTLAPDHKGVQVAAWMKDPHIQKLCGKINSFPDRFRRSFDLGSPVSVSRHVYRNKILTVELTKAPQ
jgi:ferredoxin/HSP20 family molecular chaperone IbpA